MEQWDVYNQERIKTGETMTRGENFSTDAYHLVVYVCLFNANGEMLIQHRQPFKDGWPDKWDLTAGGSALMGESSRQAAARELWEEIGYAVDLSGVRPHFIMGIENGFADFYLQEADVNIADLRLQESEVQAVRWASQTEIFQMIEDGLFIPYHKSLVALCFAMRKRYSRFTHNDITPKYIHTF